MKRRLSPDARLLRSAALRTGLLSAVAVTVTVAVLCGVTVLVVMSSQHRQQTAQLDAAVSRADDVGDPPEGMWLVLRRGATTTASPGLPRGLPEESALVATGHDGVTRTDDVHTGHAEYRVRTQRIGDGVVQAALDLRAEHEERDRLLTALLFTGLAGLVLAGAVGAWLGRRAATPLAQALALQRRFVADAGHELRTPLTLLSTRAQLLRRHLTDESLLSEVDSLVGDARQLTSIMEDLLLAADPREDAATGTVPVAEVARSAVAAAEPEAAARGVELDLHTEEVTVPGSAPAIRRAVTALLDNGIRHATARVTVTVRASGRDAAIMVGDDGPGIDEDILPKLFTRFSAGNDDGRDDGPRRRYGLGLALVSEIADRHRGSVSAGNTGHGAELRLTLPR